LINRNTLFAETFNTSSNNVINIMHTGQLRGQLRAAPGNIFQQAGGLHNIHVLSKEIAGKPVLVDTGNFLHTSGTASTDMHTINLMNKAGYAVAGLSYAEMARGEQELAALAENIRFTLVNCHYTFNHPALKTRVLPYCIVRRGDVKIGITGIDVMISPNELASASVIQTRLKKANAVAAKLKEELGCNFVVCMSNLPLFSNDKTHGNKQFAMASSHINIILTTDNSTRVQQYIALNSRGEEVVISNSRKEGTVMGNVYLTVNSERKLTAFDCNNIVPGLPKEVPFSTAYSQLA